MIAATGAMLVFNSAVIEKFLTVSVGYLYLVYFVFVVWSVVAFGDRIEANFASVLVGEDWFTAGVTYAGYNVAKLPAVLFCIRHLEIGRASCRERGCQSGMFSGVDDSLKKKIK